jgi:uncharacterized membrane protein YbjE (DUF340 family)
MLHFLPLLYILVALGLGMAAARILPRGRAMRVVMSVALYALLFFMGFRIGRSREVAARLAEIGQLSILFAFATVGGTLAVLTAAFAVQGRRGRVFDRWHAGAEIHAGTLLSHLREPGLLFGIVVVGFSVGLGSPLFPEFGADSLTTWLLYLLVFLIGAQLIQSDVRIRQLVVHPDILVVPVGTIAGSLLGAFLLSLFLPLSWGKALSVGAGFGWYSLSGVIITNLGDPVLGSAAFVSNIIRESIALLTIPLLCRTRWPSLAVGVAGATSMDVTLPLIQRVAGTATVPLAIASGAILSLAVPILVPLFYQLG